MIALSVIDPGTARDSTLASIAKFVTQFGMVQEVRSSWAWK
jgi:hypothetical protein